MVFNEGQKDVPDDDRVGVVLGTLGEPGTDIPVIGISFALGQELYKADRQGQPRRPDRVRNPPDGERHRRHHGGA